jgi:hypothetical protein
VKLPSWIPAVSRPWNPAYRPVWDVMTHQERQVSFLIDLAVIAIVMALIFLPA